MKNILINFFCFVCSSFRNRLSIQAENFALRHQLFIYKRSKKRPLIKLSDRIFWGFLSKIWSDWRDSLFIVKPETVINWRRRKFSEHWAKLIRKGKSGAPKKDKEIRRLIREMSIANPLWGSPRIMGELSKIGIDVAKSTVEKYMVKKRKPPSQTWKTFLKNHVLSQMAHTLFFRYGQPGFIGQFILPISAKWLLFPRLVAFIIIMNASLLKTDKHLF